MDGSGEQRVMHAGAATPDVGVAEQELRTVGRRGHRPSRRNGGLRTWDNATLLWRRCRSGHRRRVPDDAQDAAHRPGREIRGKNLEVLGTECRPVFYDEPETVPKWLVYDRRPARFAAVRLRGKPR